MHRALSVGMLICVAAMAVAQEHVPAAVDRADPKAVAMAYLDRVEAGDVEGALALIAGDETLRTGLKRMADELREEVRGEGMSFQTMLAEISFLPVGHARSEKTLEGAVEGNEATLSVSQTTPGQKKLVVVKDAQGQWCVDLERSIKATTGGARSFLIEEAAQAARRGGGGAAEAQIDRDHESMQAIADAAATVIEWADGHDGVLPPADTWLDDVEAYSLEGARLKRPGAKEGECGFALNAELAGKALPRGFPERDSLVLLYECADFDRNLSGDPDDELLPGAPPAGTSWIATAGARAVPIAADELPSELLQDVADGRACRAHVQALVEAVRAFARDHDGLLPEAVTWCDDIEPYLERVKVGAAAFRCPGAPDLQYGYALNEALAGLDVRSLRDHSRCLLVLPSQKGERNEARALPQTVEAGRHPDPSNRTQRYCVCVGMLGGAAESLMEGEHYPRSGM